MIYLTVFKLLSMLAKAKLSFLSFLSHLSLPQPYLLRPRGIEVPVARSTICPSSRNSMFTAASSAFSLSILLKMMATGDCHHFVYVDLNISGYLKLRLRWNVDGAVGRRCKVLPQPPFIEEELKYSNVFSSTDPQQFESCSFYDLLSLPF